MSATIANNISALLKAKGMSLRALSRKTGLSASSLSKVLKGNSTPRAENLELIAQALEVTAKELTSDSLQRSDNYLDVVAHRPIPVLTAEQIRLLCENPEQTRNIKPVSWVAETAFPDLVGQPLVALFCDTHAMEPYFENGDLLYLKGVPYAPNSEPARPRDCDYVLALAEGVKRPVLRTFVEGDIGNDWLLAENPKYPGEQKLKAEKILGVIVAKACRYG